MTGATATLPRSSGRPSGPSRALRVPRSPATGGDHDAHRRRESLDVLSARWRSALDAAQSALRAASPLLPPSALRERSAHLRLERTVVAQELEALAHDRHTEAWFSDLQVPAESLHRLLGLPAEVNACVFNLDGVLIGSAPFHAAAWAETFNAFLRTRGERTHGRFTAFDLHNDYAAHLDGRPRLDGVRAFLASRGIRLPDGGPDDPPGSETVHGLANRKRDVLLRRLEEGDLAAFAGSWRYLQLAHEAHVHCAVVSASANTQTILERTGLAGLVEASVDGNTMVAEGLEPKPAPDTLLTACRRLGVAPEHAAAFETGPAGLAAARAAGFGLVVGVGGAFATGAVLDDHGPSVTGASLDELLEQQLAKSR